MIKRGMTSVARAPGAPSASRGIIVRYIDEAITPVQAPSRASVVAVASIEGSNSPRIRVGIERRQDRVFIDIRQATRLTGVTDVWVPTKEGVSFDLAMLPELQRALAEAAALATANG
jgi:hypothetical protein